jgi:hypothetical protein
MRYGQGSGRAASFYGERRRKKRITLIHILMIVDALAFIGLAVCFGLLWKFLG